jgi:hypothetical protein
LVIAVAIAAIVGALRRRRHARRAPRPHVSPLTPVRRRSSRRNLRAYVWTIRHQPALAWKLAAFSAFSARYLMAHSVTRLLVVVTITWAIGFPVGYVLWRYRQSA